MAMNWESTAVAGAWLLTPQAQSDERGFFARTYCAREFEERGIRLQWVQCSVSYNVRAGTLRGMHYQVAPYAEAKLVRCTRGAIYDVIIDLRPDSASYLKHQAAVLSGDNRAALFVPERCAHGFQTLEANTEVFYQMSQFYMPDYGRGVLWNDPAFGIEWPVAPERIISARDASYPLFER
jgi:dTDP-4-dehydrorhamnose 3,5-epimerase